MRALKRTCQAKCLLAAGRCNLHCGRVSCWHEVHLLVLGCPRLASVMISHWLALPALELRCLSLSGLRAALGHHLVTESKTHREKTAERVGEQHCHVPLALPSPLSWRGEAGRAWRPGPELG